MNGRNVPISVNDVQSIKLWILILNPVFLKSFLHVQRSPKSLPNVACTMFVILEVPVQNFSDGLLCRHFQKSGVIIDHVDYSDPSWFFSQLTDDVLGVFPPFYLTLWVYVEILTSWTIEFACSCCVVDFDSWLPACCVKPKSDICSCGLDQRSGQGIGDVLLNHFG